MTGNTKFFLENASANTYTGVTTVDSGTLYLAAPNGVAIPGKLVVGDGIGSNESDVVRLALSNQIASTSAVSIAWTGLLDLNGFTNTIGPLTMTGGNLSTGTGTLTLTAGVTTLASSTPAVITGNLSLGTGSTPQTFMIASGQTTGNDLNIAAVVSGGPGVDLLKAGLGTMQLSAPPSGNTYLGPTLVSAGTLDANANALVDASGTTVNSGATLVYEANYANSSNIFAAGPLTLDGGSFQINGQSPSITAPGAINLAANSTIQVGAGYTLDLTGPITGSAGFTKTWAGTVELGDANSYTGATVVNNGVLDLDNAQALGSSATTVSGQGTLFLENGITFSPTSLTLAGTTAGKAALASDGTSTWTGAINLTGSATVCTTAGELTLSGPISGSAANSLTIGNWAKPSANGVVLLDGPPIPMPVRPSSAAGTLAIASVDAARLSHRQQDQQRHNRERRALHWSRRAE